MINDIAKLGKYGIVGIIISLIVLVGGVMFYAYKITGNHISHSTEAILGITKAVIESTEVSRATNNLIQDFRNELRMK